MSLGEEDSMQDVSDLCNWIDKLQLTEIGERSRYSFEGAGRLLCPFWNLKCLSDSQEKISNRQLERPKLQKTTESSPSLWFLKLWSGKHSGRRGGFEGRCLLCRPMCPPRRPPPVRKGCIREVREPRRRRGHGVQEERVCR